MPHPPLEQVVVAGDSGNDRDLFELGGVRGIVVGMTAMVMGAQTVFASFLVSLLLIERR